MILTKAWQLYKENWKIILAIVLMGGVFLGIVNALISYLGFTYARMDENKDAIKIIMIILNIVLWTGYLLWIAPLIYALKEIQAGMKITVKEAYRIAFDNFRKIVILASIIAGVYLLYVIPTYISIGFYAVMILMAVTLIIVLWHALFLPIWFLEDHSLWESLSYSRRLIAGRILAFILEFIGIYILFYVFMMLFNLIMGWPINMLFNMSQLIIYPYIFLNTLIQVIFISVIIVWIYCYYKNLKVSEL